MWEPGSFQRGNNTLPYQLLKPDKNDLKKKYPLVIFMHAAMEKGTDNKKQLKKGVGVFATNDNRAKYPAFVIAPQCPKDPQWVAVPWNTDSHKMPAEPTWSERLVLELIPALLEEFNINERRIYLTGWSMGGFATWDMAMREPQRFAALAPVCGGADESKASLIAKLPVWVFHGGADTTVKTIRSRNIVEALRKAGGDPKYTEYPDMAHDSWKLAYAEPELLSWLFAQKRP
jgi:predicted peptidase